VDQDGHVSGIITGTITMILITLSIMRIILVAYSNHKNFAYVETVFKQKQAEQIT